MIWDDPFFQLMRDVIVLASLVYLLVLMAFRLVAGVQYEYVTESFRREWLGHREPNIRRQLQRKRRPSLAPDPAKLAEFERCIYERRIGLRTT